MMMKDFLRKDNIEGKKKKDQIRKEGSITENPE